MPGTDLSSLKVLDRLRLRVLAGPWRTQNLSGLGTDPCTLPCAAGERSPRLEAGVSTEVSR